jgi:hypothetical protein
MVAPLGRTPSFALCSLLLVVGCLHDPAKPIDPDVGVAAEVGDGSLPLPDARADGAVAPDGAPDGAAGDASDDGPTVDGPDDDGGLDVGGDTAVCPGVCVIGAKRCGSGGGVQTCATGASGCPDWGAESACTGNTTCAGTPAACACKAPPAGCTAAGTFCQGTGTVATCAKDPAGCFFISGTAPCPGAQSCGGALPNGACGCTNTCSASQVGSYCADSKTVATCTASNGCYASSNPITCPGLKTCQGAGGSAACQCPAAGTTVGSGCATAGATSCDGAAVLTCATDGASGCKVWAKTSDCAALAGGPYVCGTGGGAHCQCPDATTSAIYVDPAAGSDAGGAVPSNGAASPPACRFKTLTKALGAVTASRKKIVATSATPPVSFAGETFPLTVPAGVTLGTADPTPAAGNYILVFNSGTASSAIVLADGATLEGFLVRAATGNAAASALSCTAGSVTVRGSTIVGAAGNAASKPATGIAIGKAATDSCTGALTGVEVRGFKVGLSVLTGATAALVVTDTTLRDNGVPGTGAGLQLGAGKVTATRLTVNKTSTGTATWGVILEGAAATSAPTLAANPLTVAGLEEAGLELRAGLSAPQATLTTGDLQTGDVGVRVAAGNLTATRTRIHGAIGDGVIVSGGAATLHRVTLLDNGGRGLTVSGGTVIIDDGSAVTSNGTSGAPADGIRVLGGAVTVGGATGLQVDVGANTDAGIKVLAADAGTTVSIVRAQLHNAARAGLDIDLAVDGSTVTVSDSDVHDNGTEGVRLVRGPATGGAAVSLDNVRAYLNGVGLHLRADTGDLVASVKNCAIHDNRDTGLVIRQGATFVTTATVQGNDVFHNNTAAGSAVGGILFATPSTLASFAGNKSHGNLGDELGFDAKPNGGDTWNLSGPIGCGGQPNVLSCYGTGVGLRILPTAPAGTKVNAQNVSWANAVPADGVDFGFSDPGDEVNALPACAPVTTCP